MHGINRPNLVCLNHLTFPIYINKFYKKVMELAIMKNAGWQSIGFLLLIFILTVGLSYLAFNENSSEVDNEERRMSIALVNEDEGAIFSDQRIIFGDQFSDSVNKDSKHDWYVVSRGVAESGVDRNVYDMMIIIPNDFSEKSLSIHLENPEPAELHYRINATGHENVRAEAEKTAGNILNEFNTRLTDVYFASIIGNLQEAQDNIGGIIDKEREYTDEYKQLIHSPLTGFTDQFDMVKSYTETSKESYQSLEDILEGFEADLGEDVENNQSFASELDSVIQTKEQDSKVTEVFSEVLDGFTNSMSNEEVMTVLNQIERENEAVYNQFNQGENSSGTIAQNADEINKRFSNLNERMNGYEEQLQDRLHNQLEDKVKTGLDSNTNEIYAESFDQLLASFDDQITDEIQELITDLPTLDKNKLEESGLNGETLTEIKNVADETKKFNHNPGNKRGTTEITTAIKDIKTDLSTKGLKVEDKLHIPKLEADEVEQRLFVNVPEAFRDMKIYLNGEEVEYNSDGIDLSGYEDNTEIAVNMKLRKNAQKSFDLFVPVEWDWKITQEGTSEEDDSDEEPPPSEPPEEEDNNEDEDETNQDEETSEEEENNTESSVESEVDDDNAEADTNENIEEDANDEEVEDESEADDEEEEVPTEPEEDQEPITITKTEHHNVIYKEVQTPVRPTITKTMMNATAATVDDYYKLQSVYELYFDLNFKDKSLASKLKGNKLKDLASKDSLYYFIHEEKVEDILKKHITRNVTDQVTKDVQSLMGTLEDDIKSYNEKIAEASNKSDELVANTTETQSNASVLNEEVRQLLNELADWRETGQQIQDDKNNVISSDGELQTAMMSLDGSYQPLLLASESIKDQAGSNFDVSNNVYQTFEAIDEQADTIEASGTELVQHAEELADKLTEKSIEDTDYAEDFNEVLANSRIGDRQNENLYSFLANPVHTKNEGIITKGETFTPYFIVLVLTIVTLFTAYVISTINERNLVKENTEEKSLYSLNAPVTGLIAAIGLAEGIVIGLVLFYLLKLDQSAIYMWLGLMILLTMLMLFVATYLLRQLKMVGMFILLGIISLYLFVTKSLSFKFEHNEVIEVIRSLSPLQHIENLLYAIVEENSSMTFIAFGLLIIISGLGCVLNLFVFKKTNTSKEMDDDNVAEAN